MHSKCTQYMHRYMKNVKNDYNPAQIILGINLVFGEITCSYGHIDGCDLLNRYSLILNLLHTFIRHFKLLHV